jgi:hypothetical protein
MPAWFVFPLFSSFFFVYRTYCYLLFVFDQHCACACVFCCIPPVCFCSWTPDTGGRVHVAATTRNQCKRAGAITSIRLQRPLLRHAGFNQTPFCMGWPDHGMLRRPDHDMLQYVLSVVTKPDSSLVGFPFVLYASHRPVWIASAVLAFSSPWSPHPTSQLRPYLLQLTVVNSKKFSKVVLGFPRIRVWFCHSTVVTSRRREVTSPAWPTSCGGIQSWRSTCSRSCVRHF